jgi:hypothetical protein
MAMLPAEFADLEPWAAMWCLSSEPERYDRRLKSSMGEMIAFYEAVTPRAEAAMTYLDRYPLSDLPDDATNLLHLLYSTVMVSFPVEAWSQPKVPDTGATSFDCYLEPVP